MERKRHIGNDIAVIIFQDSEEPFQLSSILSRQNHIFLIVKPEGDKYRYAALILHACMFMKTKFYETG